MKNAIVKELQAEKKRLTKELALVDKTLGKFAGSGGPKRRQKKGSAKTPPATVVKAKRGPKPGRKSKASASAASAPSAGETLQEIRERKARLMAEQATRKGGEIGQPV